MIVCHLKERIAEKGISMHALARGAKSNRNALIRMSENRARQVDMVILDRLCIFLECPIGDILSWAPGGEELKPVSKAAAGRYGKTAKQKATQAKDAADTLTPVGPSRLSAPRSRTTKPPLPLAEQLDAFDVPDSE